MPPAAKAEADVDEIVSVPKKPDPAAEKFWTAVRLLQSGSSTELASGRSALQAVADQEYTHGQVLLGNCLVSGSYGFPKDARKAFNLFRLAAERGNAFAKISLGSCYATGTGVRKDDAKAAEWLMAALAPDADFAQPERSIPVPGVNDDRLGANVAGEMETDPVSESQATAHFLLAQILTRQKKPGDAHSHYLAAATAGPDGHNGLYGAAVQAALNYAFGRGVPRDMDRATEMLARSRRLNARQQISLIHNYVSLKMVDEFAVADLEEQAGEAGANQETILQMNIATVFGDKKSKDYNVAEAVKWYELAAESGQVWAMLQLGLIHARGELGRADPEAAFAWFEKAGGGTKLKHYLGVANLAICYQNGFGTPKDPAKAATLFRKHRNADIVCYLGSINECPTAPLSFEDASTLADTWARQMGDAHAQYLLGLRYLNGWGVEADRNSALKWLKKSAKSRHGGALCMLGLLAENTRTDFYGFQIVTDETLKMAADYYRLGSEAGDPDAIANYANFLQQGRGVPQDVAKAEAYFLKCLEIAPDHARAHSNLASIYAEKLAQLINKGDQESIKAHRARMLEHYEAAVRLEFPYAARNLGTLYGEGRLLPQDFAKAYRYFEQATEWGLPAVHFQLGHMHEYGQGVPVTLAEAAYHYRLAALEGHDEALRRLVNFYLSGIGVSLNLDRAAFWMLQLTRRGNLVFLPSYCDILLKKGDYATAIPLLRDLSKSPNEVLAGYGYERLSECYQGGLGVKVDSTRARKYFNEAFKRNNGTALYQAATAQMKQGNAREAVSLFQRAAPSSPDAGYVLGRMYFFGTNVEQDRVKAISYLRAAANGRHRDALFFLAALACNNDPSAPPVEEAIRFAQQAENLGHIEATKAREMLERRRKNEHSPSEEAVRTRSS